MKKLLWSTALLAVGFLAAKGVAQPAETKLVASDAVAEDRVGTAVAASGDTVAVGSLWHGHYFPHAGAVYLYRQQPSGSWIQEAELLASDGRGRENFGRALAMDGDLLVVGSWGGGTNNAGSAYVFRFNGAAWMEEAKLEPSDGTGTMLFGGSVSVDGDVIAVGAQNGAGREANTGAVYVYRFDGTQWTQEAKVIASDGQRADAFHAVAILGDTLLVGAFGVAVQEPFEGAAYVYRFDGWNWEERQRIQSPSPTRYGDFASAVSLTEGYALVSDNGSRQAAVFRREPTGLVLDSVARDPDPRLTDGSFGVPPVYTGGALIVGEGLDRENGLAAGAAWVFRPGGSVWDLDTKILPSDGAAGDNFGFAIGPSCTSLVIGSRHDESKTGSAYVFTGLMAAPPAVDLAPVFATLDPGGTHRLTATVLDDQGRPLRGCEVRFRVVSGPNEGAIGTCGPASRCVSTAAGQLTFSYTGNGASGTDEVEACVIERSRRSTCAPLSSVEWRPRNVRVDIAPGNPKNTVVPHSRRLLGVALFGEADFDAAGSVGLTFGPGFAPEQRSSTTDVDDDGFLDRLGWFRVDESGVAAGDESACLRGETPTGQAFEGCDALFTPGVPR